MNLGRRASLPILSAVLFLAAPDANAGLNASLTLEGDYARVLTQNSLVGHNNGSGATALLEILPADFIAFGAALNGTYYWGIETPGPTWSGFLDGTIRLTPWPRIQDLQSYLLVGGGVNLLKDHSDAWNGDWHAMGGLGIRYFLDPRVALDLGARFHFLTPETDPLQTINANLGLTFFVADTFKKKSGPKASSFHFDSLKTIAARVYDDADLYPILVDANWKVLSKPLTLPAGTNLVVPTTITAAQRRDAKLKAKQPDYIRAERSFEEFRLSTAAYRDGEGLSAPGRSDEAPAPLDPKRRSIPFRSASLWDVAAREDVYGDPELYPLLVDANRRKLRLDGPQQEIQLVIPKPNREQVKDARIKSWAVEYILFRGKDVSQKQYEAWRLERGMGPSER